jgi:hypothetical protein
VNIRIEARGVSGPDNAAATFHSREDRHMDMLSITIFVLAVVVVLGVGVYVIRPEKK